MLIRHMKYFLSSGRIRHNGCKEPDVFRICYVEPRFVNIMLLPFQGGVRKEVGSVCEDDTTGRSGLYYDREYQQRPSLQWQEELQRRFGARDRMGKCVQESRELAVVTSPQWSPPLSEH